MEEIVEKWLAKMGLSNAVNQDQRDTLAAFGRFVEIERASAAPAVATPASESAAVGAGDEPYADTDADEFLHPETQVFFRAGLLACREYMARFVSHESPTIAASIRANWWPSLGQDFGAPRRLGWDEMTVGEYGEEGFRAKTAEEVSPTQEALPIALQFLQSLDPGNQKGRVTLGLEGLERSLIESCESKARAALPAPAAQPDLCACEYSRETSCNVLDPTCTRNAPAAQGQSESAAVRWIVVGYGETDNPQAAFVQSREGLLDAVLGMIYTNASDADEETREMYAKDLDDEDEWSRDGTWSTEFEIGGITVYDLGGEVKLSPTNVEIDTAIETLRHVIDCLRKNGSYIDEEGEATDFLEPLLEARLAAPLPPASAASEATVKIYETYTGQNGWLEVTQDEYDRTKDKYEHRIRRVRASPVASNEHKFKNFHRLLCERFGYVHDEKDWKRDQISLIEHIAKRVASNEREALVAEITMVCNRYLVKQGNDFELGGDKCAREVLRALLAAKP